MDQAFELIAARAEESDRSSLVRRENFQLLARAGYNRMLLDQQTCPKIAWGCIESLAAACGVTSFVQAQHSGAIGFLSRGLSQPGAERAVEDLLCGDRLCGVAFAHLRRPVSPVAAYTTSGGYLFEGEAPWFSGWGLMDQMVLGGRTPEGLNIYALVDCVQSGVQALESEALMAMNASGTVGLKICNLFVPEQQVVLRQTPQEMEQKDFGSVVRYAAPPLGLVEASSRHLQNMGLNQGASNLREQAQQIRSEAWAWPQRPDEQLALEIRVRANQLALNAAQAAVVASGGAANRVGHPAGRWLREASFYFLTQLTAGLKMRAIEKLSQSYPLSGLAR